MKKSELNSLIQKLINLLLGDKIDKEEVKSN